MSDRFDAVVVGAGPAGLAAAAELRGQGVDVLVLDDRTRPGDSWRGHYDRLRLNTARELSHLPGLRIPQAYGRWVARDDVVRYLDAYVRHHRIPVHWESEATKIEPGTERRWSVRLADGGHVEASSVVVATGYCRRPRIPQWPGRDEFAGGLIHSSDYRNPARYVDSNVLVVGGGNSAAEIAIDLAEGGARTVWMSLRTTPAVVPRTIAGLPTILVAIGLRRAPARLGDAVVSLLQRVAYPDLAQLGLAGNGQGVSEQFARTDVVPITHPSFVPTLRDGRIKLVRAVASLRADAVVLADGSEVRPDAVIAATGFDRALGGLVGDLGLVDEHDLPVVHGPASAPSASGIHFIGFTNPLSGNLRELRLDAGRIARAVAAEEDVCAHGAPAAAASA